MKKSCGAIFLLFGFLNLNVVAEEKQAELSVRELYQQGEDHFFAGRFKKSITSWDAEIARLPARDPYHWQRGLGYYYAEDFDKGVKQFERHQKVNGNDVENAVWHFLCAVKRKGGSVEKARKALIPIEGDTRVPMKEVHDLFAGKGTEKAVLEAAGKADDKLYRRNQLCYAHLYLGLYHEALGDAKKSLEHMKKAAVDYRMDHYMGKVAQVHFKERSSKEKKGENEE
jgi:lipoprotein NlpI